MTPSSAVTDGAATDCSWSANYTRPAAAQYALIVCPFKPASNTNQLLVAMGSFHENGFRCLTALLQQLYSVAVSCLYVLPYA